MEISQLSCYSHFLKSIDVAKAFEIFAVILFYDEILLVWYLIIEIKYMILLITTGNKS